MQCLISLTHVRIHPLWPTWTRDPWPPSSPPASCGWHRCWRCSRCSAGFSASLSPFHKIPVFSWRSRSHCKPSFTQLQLCRGWRLVLYCGGFQSCEEGLVGAIDGRRLAADCSSKLGPSAAQFYPEEISAKSRGKVPASAAGVSPLSGWSLARLPRGEWASMGLAEALDRIPLVQLVCAFEMDRKNEGPSWTWKVAWWSTWTIGYLKGVHIVKHAIWQFPSGFLKKQQMQFSTQLNVFEYCSL